MASPRPAVTSTAWAVVLVTVVVSGCYTTAAGEVYNVKHYGAYGNGVADDTLAIQAAINAADEAGGGTVWLPPPGTYGGGTYLSGSLWLASNIFFNVSAGATLLGSPWYDSYPAAWRGSFYGTSRAGLLNGGRCEDKPLPAAGQECKKLRRIVNVTIGVQCSAVVVVVQNNQDTRSLTLAFCKLCSRALAQSMGKARLGGMPLGLPLRLWAGAPAWWSPCL